MEKILAIGIDLGGDTVKIAYATEETNGVAYGKFVCDSPLVQIAIPAVAFYNTDSGEWRFGVDVDKSDNRNFITVVKIKNLLSLLSSNDDEQVNQKNSDYYYNQNEFPKFYFPVKRKILNDFELMSKQGMTFVAPNHTPRSVCEEFFSYLHAIITDKAMELEDVLGVEFDDIKISLLHPAHASEMYIEELSHLLEQAFGQGADKVLSNIKALTMYAEYRGVIGEDDRNVLIFDLGEEEISVAKACYVNGALVIEGVEGHNLPIQTGGVSVDQAINEFLERQISTREIMGKPSYGNEGYVDEKSVYASQYLLMKDIKKAKIILSQPIKKNSFFANGVPINLSRDLILQRLFTREDLLECVGITDGDKVAKEIYDYVKTELLRPTNRNVEKIFISGGLSETYGLIDFIRRKINSEFAGVEVHSFDDNVYEGGEFNILSNEDNIYATAVGGAIIALKDMDVKTVISLSYATWAYRGEQEKCLEIFVNRGQPIEPGMEFSTQLSLGGTGVNGEEMFSAIITEYEMRGRKYAGKIAYSFSGKLIIGENGSDYRQAVNEVIDLKLVAGGKNSSIYFKYRGERIKILGDSVVQFKEGIRVDRNGKATPFIKNCSPKKMVWISNGNHNIMVNVQDIEVVFDSVNDFSVSKD